MSDPPGYELQEIVEGVTFTYRTRGEDPFVTEALGRTNSGGDYEDMLLSADGDESAMPIVDARPVSFDVVSILAYQGKARFARYTINTASQTWTRDGGAGPSAGSAGERPSHPDRSGGRGRAHAADQIRGRRRPRRVRGADAPGKHVPDGLEPGDAEIHPGLQLAETRQSGGFALSDLSRRRPRRRGARARPGERLDALRGHGMRVQPERPRLLRRASGGAPRGGRSARGSSTPRDSFRSVAAIASAACSSSGRYGLPCISIAAVTPFRAVPIPFETRPPTPGMKLAALDAALLAVLTCSSRSASGRRRGPGARRGG